MKLPPSHPPKKTQNLVPKPQIQPTHLREVLQGQVSFPHEEIGFKAVFIALSSKRK